MSEVPSSVMEQALKLIKPDEDLREKVNQTVEKVIKNLKEVFWKIDQRIEVELEGSIAKDTWTSKDIDADIFILFPKDYSKNEIGKITISSVISKYGKERCLLRYAEHPYVTINFDFMDVDVVPCYKVEPPNWLSATDRSVYHTKFVKSKFNDKLKDSARLLKVFLKSIGAYGAEIKVGGFSGFLCELLVYNYGGFLETVKAFSEIKLPLIIDPTKKVVQLNKTPTDVFNSEFVVIDPIDPERNVAAAVTKENFWKFSWACRSFLRRPSLSYFQLEVPQEPSLEAITDVVSSGALKVYGILVKPWKAPPDVFWGQIKRILKRIENKARQNNFNIIKSDAWSDESEELLFLFVLESDKIEAKEQLGPKTYDYENAEKFIKKHLNDKDTLFGPFIKDERWYVLKKRSLTTFSDMLNSIVSSDEFLSSLPQEVISSFKSFKILKNTALVNYAISSEDRKKVFVRLLFGREWWIKNLFYD
ncbi:MAG: CCA tRNA nucleotidyltransferase [Thermoproteota archaeon]